MRVIYVLSLILYLGAAAQAATGDVVVSGPPGFRIFVDGEFAGVTTEEEEGLLLAGLDAGIHTIRAEKAGHPPRDFSVVAGPIRAEVRIEEDPSGDTEAAAGVTQAVGRIVVTSEPENCLVQFAGERMLKDKPTKTIREVPVGNHKIFFERYGVVLSTRVDVEAGEATTVMADFVNNRVGILEKEDPAETDLTEEQAARSECVEWWVEVMRVTDQDVIEEISGQLDEIGFPSYHQAVITVRDESDLPFYKIRVGPINDKKTAKWSATKLRNAGFKGAWPLPALCQGAGQSR